ncbi:MAG: hypothetical protein JW902_19680, partial [Syntrophaceae bacterium]|nr:hypothetical protein [Syntrophaceae bacterium]
EATFIYLTKEDGVVEWIGAISLLLCSFMFLLTYLNKREGNNLFILKTHKNIFFLFLAVLFFFGFGEEISWGQRIFKFNTPKSFSEFNVQNEFNIHNLTFFNKQSVKPSDTKERIWGKNITINFLFNFFCLIYCGAIPLINRLSPWAANFIRQVYLPVVPGLIAFAFVIFIVSFEVYDFFIEATLKQPVCEWRECILSVFFLITSIYWYNLRYLNDSVRI